MNNGQKSENGCIGCAIVIAVIFIIPFIILLINQFTSNDINIATSRTALIVTAIIVTLLQLYIFRYHNIFEKIHNSAFFRFLNRGKVVFFIFFLLVAIISIFRFISDKLIIQLIMANKGESFQFSDSIETIFEILIFYGILFFIAFLILGKPGFLVNLARKLKFHKEELVDFGDDSYQIPGTSIDYYEFANLQGRIIENIAAGSNISDLGKSAKAGDTEAMLKLGILYWNGIETERNVGCALQWFGWAAYYQQPDAIAIHQSIKGEVTRFFIKEV